MYDFGILNDNHIGMVDLETPKIRGNCPVADAQIVFSNKFEDYITRAESVIVVASNYYRVSVVRLSKS